MKVWFERGALTDLDDIFSYIAQDNPEAASRLVARIEALAPGATPAHWRANQKSEIPAAAGWGLLGRL